MQTIVTLLLLATVGVPAALADTNPLAKAIARGRLGGHGGDTDLGDALRVFFKI